MMQIIGAGLCCIDIIDVADKHIIQNGGTCTNVLSALSVLGWRSVLLKPHYSGKLNHQVDRVLHSLGVEVVTYTKTSAPMPRVIEKHNGDHLFYTKCPCCNQKLLSLVLPTDSNIEKLCLDYKSYDVFFHDRVSSGINHIVDSMIDASKLVIYEPNGFRNEKILLDHCLSCDIVKFSCERIPMRVANNLRNIAASGRTKLIICTEGSKGLHFTFRCPEVDDKMSAWQTILPIYPPKVQDTSGAGDWFTAGFLFEWFRGTHRIHYLQETPLVKALEAARKYANQSTSFLGAQGILYSNTFMESHKRVPLLHSEFTLCDNVDTTCSCCGKERLFH